MRSSLNRGIWKFAWIISVILNVTVLPCTAAPREEPVNCGFQARVRLAMLLGINNLTVTDQIELTAPVQIEDARKGNFIFFRNGQNWNCPNGISGIVIAADKFAIKFVVDVIKDEQVLFLPSASNQSGNEWFRLGPEIRRIQ